MFSDMVLAIEVDTGLEILAKYILSMFGIQHGYTFIMISQTSFRKCFFKCTQFFKICL